jgi:hypothetical protein
MVFWCGPAGLTPDILAQNSEPPIFFKNQTSDFFNKRRNVVRVGTFLRPKLQLRIGEHLKTFDGTLIKFPEKSVWDTGKLNLEQWNQFTLDLHQAAI